MKLLPLAALVGVLSFAGLARADDALCNSSSTIGKSCKTAGPHANQPGICESAPCDGGTGPDDAGTCFACLVDGTAGGCGGGRPVDSKASFTPTVGGCCSVAGAHSWETGVGLLLGTFFIALAVLERRRNRPR